MRFIKRRWNCSPGITAIALALTLMSGCAADSPPATRTAPASLPVARVYLFRGLLGIWSHGLDTLATQLRSRGIDADVYPYTSWTAIGSRVKAAPGGVIILVGHSWGADDAIRLARELQKSDIPVALLATIDPVTPPKVPVNVGRALNLFESNGIRDVLPWWRGVPLSSEGAATSVVNIDVHHERPDLGAANVTHGSITNSRGIQLEILREIENEITEKLN